MTTAVAKRGGATITVTFGGAVTAASAGDPLHYVLVQRVKKGKKTVEKPIPIKSVAFDPATGRAVLTLKKALPKGGSVELRLAGSSFRDPSGRPLQGDRTATIGKKGTVTLSAALAGGTSLDPAAVDAALAEIPAGRRHHSGRFRAS